MHRKLVKTPMTNVQRRRNGFKSGTASVVDESPPQTKIFFALSTSLYVAFSKNYVVLYISDRLFVDNSKENIRLI